MPWDTNKLIIENRGRGLQNYFNMDMKTSLQTLFGKYLDKDADQNQLLEDLVNFVNITIDIKLGKNPKLNKEGPFIPKKRKRPNKGKSKR